MRGMGREIHFISTGYYQMMDRCKPGANIRGIRRTIVESLSELEPDKLVVIERGNGLPKIGEQKTVQLF